MGIYSLCIDNHILYQSRKTMKQYLELLKYVYDHGVYHQDRTGVGTKSIFGYQMRINLLEGFPLVTTKQIHIKSVIHELLWFLKGDTNIKYLNDHNVTIWNEWADNQGNLGPIYGYQWRHWKHKNGLDQITNLIHEIKTNPDSRRLIISAWNVNDLADMALYPCHVLMQFYVENRKLSCQLYQRSADLFLGVPFNIASYSLLIHMIAHVCDLQPYEFIHTFGNAHIYMNHLDQVKTQLERTPYPLPTLIINDNVKNIFNFEYKDFTIKNYKYHPKLKADIAV